MIPAALIPAPSTCDVTAQLDTQCLASLSDRQRAVLVTLMARVSERSYRRGVQQGATFEAEGDRLRPELLEWRYTTTTDASPFADSNQMETALERLHIENKGLAHLGFPTAVHGVGSLDGDDLLLRLSASAQEYQRCLDDKETDLDVALAKADVRAIAIEINTLAGFAGLVDVYDDMVERFGTPATRGLQEAWTGVGGWHA